jgi:hypothetical protein
MSVQPEEDRPNSIRSDNCWETYGLRLRE